MAKEYKILLKTLADTTGLSKLGRYLTTHSAGVRNLIRTYHVLKATGAAALRALASAYAGVARVAKLTTGLVVSLTAAVGASTREFVAFNGGMARAWTMAGWGVGEFVKIRKQIIGMAGDLGVAKSQLTAGLYQALSKGVPQDNVLTFLGTAAKVAITDGSEVAAVVDGLTTVLNAFGIQADRTSEVADKMFMTVKTGGTTFQELADYMFQAAPAAAAANLGFEHINAAIATLTKGGTPTSVAMTQVRAAIMGLNKVLGDGWAQNMTLAEGMQAVRDEAGGSQTTLLELVGSTEALMAILGMTGEKAQMAAQDLKAQANAVGVLDAAYRKVDTQGQHWPKLWETILGVVTQLGNVFDNVLKPVVDDIRKSLGKWSEETTFFAGLEERLTRIRDSVLGIVEVIRGGGGADVWESAKNILVGGLKMGIEIAGKWLIQQAPIIGDLIGRAAKKAIEGVTTELDFEAAEKELVDEKKIEKKFGRRQVFGKTIGTSEADEALIEQRMREKRIAALRNEGSESAAGLVGVGGKEQYEMGIQQWASLAKQGTAARATRIANEPAPAPAPKPYESPFGDTSNYMPDRTPAAPTAADALAEKQARADELQRTIKHDQQQIAQTQSNARREQDEATSAAGAVSDLESTKTIGGRKYNERSFSYRSELRNRQAAAKKEQAEAGTGRLLPKKSRPKPKPPSRNWPMQRTILAAWLPRWSAS